MILNIISPEKIIYKGETEFVTLPGINGTFTILERHAPIISILNKGHLIYQVFGKNISIDIEEGVVEKKDNIITVCIE